MITPAKALAYIEEGPDQTLDLMFHFEHMCADCLFTDYVPIPFSLRRLKRAFGRWQEALDGKAWNALYIENHDHPRVVSRYGSEAYRVESAKLLAASYLFQKGTPFVYQGQEIGMTNTRFSSIEEVPDVSAQNQYRNRTAAGAGEKDVMALINRAARDHARTPMQWSGEANAGFCPEGVEPWFAVNPNYRGINVEAAEQDEASVLGFYRQAIALRRSLPVVREGSYREFKRSSSKLYVYARESADQRLLVMCNFADTPTLLSAPSGYDLGEGRLELCNYEDAPGLRVDDFLELRPWECRVYLFCGLPAHLDELLGSQQGELDAVAMYNSLADAVEGEHPHDAETFRQLARDEARHASVFHKLTGRILAPSSAQARALVALYKAVGRRALYPLIAQGEYRAARRYEHLVDEYPEVATVRDDETRHGDTVRALLKG